MTTTTTTTKLPSIFAGENHDPNTPKNNAKAPPRLPIVGIDGRLWCPACKGMLSRSKMPPACPECLQKLVKLPKPGAVMAETPAVSMAELIERSGLCGEPVTEAVK